jgi:serine/threonine protein kinase
MRHVSPKFAPERFAPDPIVVRIPEWRRLDDGRAEMLLEPSGRWNVLNPIFRAALEVLEEGGGFEAASARAIPLRTDGLEPKHVRMHLRRFFWKLHKLGHLRIPLEEPPETFQGRYRRVKELGRGGIGVAHLCRDEQEDRLVVVKHAWGYLQSPAVTDASMRAEGRAVKAFSHEGIVAFHDEFELDGLYHLVREYCDGTGIGGGIADADRRRDLALRLADVSLHINERGYLFFDMTPANFMLRADGSPLLVDVGLCKRAPDGTRKMGKAIGSRGYAAPEVIDKGVASRRSEVYQFGCFYQYLLTGEHPSNRMSREVREKALADAPEAERAFVLACTADDPQARLESARAVKDRLLALPRA